MRGRMGGSGPTAKPPQWAYPTLAEGTRVMALDRGNFGVVVEDFGEFATVYFKVARRI